jgi:hypothetical protein
MVVEAKNLNGVFRYFSSKEQETIALCAAENSNPPKLDPSIRPWGCVCSEAVVI